MSKFNTTTAHPRTGASVITATGDTIVNHQGGSGVARDAKSELFLMAVSDMGGEDTFYETGNERVNRLVSLARAVAAEDPEWTRKFVYWLRGTANMRTAALVIGLEAAAGGAGRDAATFALQRADEPGEALAYWHAKHGRRTPAAVKRGIADAARSLYRQRSYAKYDSARRGYRFADVIELTHPRPVDTEQSDLFRYAINARHRDSAIPLSLGVLRAREAFLSMPKDAQRAVLTGPDAEANLNRAALTWETVGSAVGLDAETWAAIIPTMGYMALIRNLRNFEDARVADTVLDEVARRIADPAEVAKSKQLPLRFLSAYRSVNGLRFKYPLERALNASLAGVPALSGRTLILIDRSASMFQLMSARSDATMADTAALFGTALALRAEDATLILYGSEAGRVNGIKPGASLLEVISQYPNMGGTNTGAALRATYSGHDRVILLTDEQHSRGGYAWIAGSYRPTGNPFDEIPTNIPLYVWNLAGYKAATGQEGPNRVWMGGLTDQSFSMIQTVEAGRDARWPWES